MPVGREPNMKSMRQAAATALVPNELVSSVSHLAGALCAAEGAVILAARGIADSVGSARLFSLLVFALSMTALYTSSGIYHLSKARGRSAAGLRKLDHAMIYVLIAGSYTPVCLFYLPAGRAAVFVTILWIAAAIGIIVKMFAINAPNWISATIYILMGWAVVFDFSLFWNADPQGMSLIAAGGCAYTIGGVIYALKRPNFSSVFGFHELFHMFILVGSFLHYIAVLFFMA